MENNCGSSKRRRVLSIVLCVAMLLGTMNCCIAYAADGCSKAFSEMLDSMQSPIYGNAVTGGSVTGGNIEVTAGNTYTVKSGTTVRVTNIDKNPGYYVLESHNTEGDPDINYRDYWYDLYSDDNSGDGNNFKLLVYIYVNYYFFNVSSKDGSDVTFSVTYYGQIEPDAELKGKFYADLAYNTTLSQEQKNVCYEFVAQRNGYYHFYFERTDHDPADVNFRVCDSFGSSPSDYSIVSGNSFFVVNTFYVSSGNTYYISYKASDDVNEATIRTIATFNDMYGVHYYISDNEAYLTYVTTGDVEYEIPSELGGAPVVQVCDSAIDGFRLNKINVPASVKCIEDGAFSCCPNLSEVNVDPDNAQYTSINGVLFNKDCTKLLYCPPRFTGTFKVPASAADIDFGLLPKFVSGVEVEEGNPSYSVKDGVVFSKDGKTLIKAINPAADYVMPESVTTIADYAFSQCSEVKSVKISDKVTDIAYYSFESCYALESVTMPTSLKSISDYAFSSCWSLKDISLPNTTETIGNGSFFGNTSLKRASLGNGLKSIGNGAFDMSALISISLPDSLQTAGESSFAYCHYLSIVELGGGLKHIADSMFKYSDSLRSITIPQNIESIDDYAFYGSGLLKIDIPDNVTSLGEYSFAGCSDMTEAKIGNGIKTLPDNAFYLCNSLENISISGSVETIGEYAFSDNQAVTSIDIPDSVTEICYGAFRNCRNLSDITAPTGLSRLGGHVLDNTAWFSAQPIGDMYFGTVAYGYKDRATSGNANFYTTSGNVPENYVLNIKQGTLGVADYAFENQGNISQINLPSTLIHIGKFSFAKCGGVDEIVLPESLKSVDFGAFINPSYKSVTIPYGVESIGQYAFGYYCDYWDFHDGIIPEKIDDFVIRCYYGTAGYDYAVSNGFDYELIEPELPVPEMTSATLVKTGVSVNWMSMESVDGYNIYRKTDNGELTKLTAVSGAASNSYTDTAVICGKAYTYFVSAYKATLEGKYETDGLSVTVNNHPNASGTVVKPTCITGGYTQYTCPDCGAVYQDNKVSALGHSYDSKVTKPATCTEEGIRTFTCKNDATHTYTEPIKMLGHDYSKMITKQPTCTEKGVMTYTCTHDASHTYTEDISPKGHSFKNGICKNCGAIEEPGLVSVANGKGAVVFKWKSVASADSYYVYRKAGTGKWSKVATVKGAKNVTYTDSDISNGVTYTYRVVAVKGKLKSTYSKTGISGLYLSAPKISSLTNNSNGIVIKWSANSKANSYKLYRKTGSSSWSVIYTGKNTSFTDKTAKHGVKYTYTVRALSGNSISTYYSGTALLRIAAPKTLSTSVKASSIVLKWSKLSGVDGYYVYRMAGNGSWKKIATIKNGKTVSYTDKDVKSGTDYSYRVLGYKGAVRGGYSKTGITLRFLSTPKLVSAKSVKTGITVKYGAVTGASSYNIYRKTSSGWKKIATVTGGTKTSYTDKTVKKGATYTYTVRACYSNSISSYNTSGISCKKG